MPKIELCKIGNTDLQSNSKSGTSFCSCIGSRKVTLDAIKTRQKENERWMFRRNANRRPTNDDEDTVDGNAVH